MDYTAYIILLVVIIIVVILLILYELFGVATQEHYNNMNMMMSQNVQNMNQNLNQNMNPSNTPLFGISPIDSQIDNNIEYFTESQGNFSSSGPTLSTYPQIQSTMIDLSSNKPYSTIETNASNTFTFNDGSDVSNNSMNNITHYDPNNYSITYHSVDLSSSIYDVSVNIPNATYYTPDTRKYDPKGWVPNYEESVYLSKLTGLSTTSTLYDTASMKSGFCKQYANDPQGLEEYCGKLDKNVCASTSCCVLLGGAKCVGGNENGPHQKKNYNDVLVKDRDYYYYNGKCYGDCKE